MVFGNPGIQGLSQVYAAIDGRTGTEILFSWLPIQCSFPALLYNIKKPIAPGLTELGNKIAFLVISTWGRGCNFFSYVFLRLLDGVLYASLYVVILLPCRLSIKRFFIVNRKLSSLLLWL